MYQKLSNFISYSSSSLNWNTHTHTIKLIVIIITKGKSIQKLLKDKTQNHTIFQSLPRTIVILESDFNIFIYLFWEKENYSLMIVIFLFICAIYLFLNNLPCMEITCKNYDFKSLWFKVLLKLLEMEGVNSQKQIFSISLVIRKKSRDISFIWMAAFILLTLASRHKIKFQNKRWNCIGLLHLSL